VFSLPKLDQKETFKFRLLFLTFLFFNIGLIWAGNTIRAELVTISLDFFAQAQLIGSIAVIVLSLFYTALVDTISKDRMFIFITFAGAASIIFATGLIVLRPEDDQSLTFLILWVLYLLMFYLWVIHWGTFIIDIYDSRTAKQIYPLVSAARPFGAIVAGFSYSLLTSFLNFATFEIMVTWIFTLILTGVLLATISFSLRREPQLDDSSTVIAFTQSPNNGWLSNFNSVTEGLNYVRESSFIRWMAFSALLVIALNTLTDFEASRIIESADFIANSDNPTEAFANFTAFWDGISNVLVLVLQLFVFSTIMEKLGIRNMILIYPLMAFSVSAGLIATPIVLTAVLALVNVNSLRRVFRDPVVGLLGNAVPARAKGRVRAVINGLISPAGAMIAAALLQLGEAFIAPLLGITALLYLLSGFVLRRQYSNAMVRVLEQESMSFMLANTPDLDAVELGVVDKTKLEVFRRQVYDTDDTDFKVFLIQLISETGGKEAVPIISEFLSDSKDALFRKATLHAFIRYGSKTRRACDLFMDLRDDKDDEVRRLAWQGLEQCFGTKNRKFQRLAHKALRDSSPRVREQIIPVMMRSRSGEFRKHGRSALNALFNSQVREQLLPAIRITSEIGNSQDIERLIPYLEAEDDDVRYEATIAVHRLWDEKIPKATYQQLVDRIPMFLDDPVDKIRLAELEILGHIHTDEASETLTSALLDRNEDIRNAAVSALVDAGELAIPHLENALKSESKSQARYAVIALNQINPQRNKDLLNRYIDDSLDTIFRNYARIHALAPYTAFASVRILDDALRFENNQLLDEIFKLLENIDTNEDSHTAMVVVREFLNSTSSAQRANGLETLEALTSPQITRRLAPIYNPDTTLADLAQMNTEDEVNLSQEAFDVLFKFAFDSNHWLGYVMLYAFAEIGRVHPDLPTIMPETKDTKRAVPASIAQLNATQLIDIRFVVAALKGSTISEDPYTRVTAKAALRVLRGQTDKKKEEGKMLSIVERMIVLKRIPIFNDILVEQLQVMAKISVEKLFKEGDILFRQNDPGDELYIVVDGQVSIGLFNDDESEFTVLATYSESSFFGEMTLFRGGTRSATAIAATDILALTIRREALTTLIKQYPELAIELLRTVSDHLANANTRIADLTAQTHETKPV
jgi:HEAT repeat protein